MSPRVLVVVGTGTDVGKTVATAALAAEAAARGLRVGLCKPVQTGLAPGEPGDVDEAARLAGIPAADTAEFRRFPDPLAPETAARLAGTSQPTAAELAAAVAAFANRRELSLVEGAGGVLVRLGTDLTVLDLARAIRDTGLEVEMVVVVRAGLGTLNDSELTVREIGRAGLRCRGLVVGAAPARPDLAARCNVEDLPRLTGVPVLGQVPDGVGRWSPERFRAAAPGWFGPARDDPGALQS